MDELPPDFELGGYVVRQCIGRGGMARVYRAEHVALRKPVALKLMDAALVGQAAGTQRFLGEARAAAAVKHRNVVEILDVGVWEERPYIVMELLDGIDLDRHIELRGALSEAEVVALALPIVAGVGAVHDAGIVHRDLKPSNIFLTPSSEHELVPKVLDFGISKLSERLQEPGSARTGTAEVIGTPKYMPPEALDGVRELGPAADQYSLGVVLYECAVGHPPFLGDTLLQILKAIALGTFTAPRAARPELSPAFEAVILRAMSVNPEERFPSLRDLGRALWPLGDERTRVIWERTFGDAGSESLATRERTMNVGLVRDRTRSLGLRSRRALAAALGVGAALMGTWGVLSRKGTITDASSGHAAMPPPGVLAPLPVEPPRSESSAPPAHAIEATALPAEVAPRAIPRDERSPAPPGKPAPRVASTSSKRVAPARSARTNDADQSPLFESKAPKRAQAGPDDELRGLFREPARDGLQGSNGSPILD